ncbi:PWI domain-containing protein [Xylariaceae sp. FL0255]|nr:PWI domain-containing protein [Xylariaceae sp. FL0255]
MATTVDAKLLRATKFPPEFSRKVDMQKVNLQVMKKWIASRISEILGAEDDVVIELCFNLIDGPRFPDIKALQIQLTGFLDKDTASFCQELWKLCLSAQTSPQGVPKELLEAKKLELIQEKIDADKAAEEARTRREVQERRDRELNDIRERERRDQPSMIADEAAMDVAVAEAILLPDATETLTKQPVVVTVTYMFQRGVVEVAKTFTADATLLVPLLQNHEMLHPVHDHGVRRTVGIDVGVDYGRMIEKTPIEAVVMGVERTHPLLTATPAQLAAVDHARQRQKDADTLLRQVVQDLPLAETVDG